MDTVACDDYPIILKAKHSAARQMWNDGDTASIKITNKTLKYGVQSFRNCDVYADTFNVTVSNCSCTVSIPDAFTPNNDGHNDQFKALGTDITEFTLRLYNRYGQCVFQTTEVSRTWDGTFQGRDCDMGTYFYFVCPMH